MKRNWKRILSLWLTVCMVFTMNFGLGATAVYAATAPTVDAESGVNAVMGTGVNAAKVLITNKSTDTSAVYAVQLGGTALTDAAAIKAFYEGSDKKAGAEIAANTSEAVPVDLSEDQTGEAQDVFVYFGDSTKEAWANAITLSLPAKETTATAPTVDAESGVNAVMGTGVNAAKVLITNKSTDTSAVYAVQLGGTALTDAAAIKAFYEGSDKKAGAEIAANTSEAVPVDLSEDQTGEAQDVFVYFGDSTKAAWVAVELKLPATTPTYTYSFAEEYTSAEPLQFYESKTTPDTLGSLVTALGITVSKNGDNKALETTSDKTGDDYDAPDQYKIKGVYIEDTLYEYDDFDDELTDVLSASMDKAVKVSANVAATYDSTNETLASADYFVPAYIKLVSKKGVSANIKSNELKASGYGATYGEIAKAISDNFANYTFYKVNGGEVGENVVSENLIENLKYDIYVTTEENYKGNLESDPSKLAVSDYKLGEGLNYDDVPDTAKYIFAVSANANSLKVAGVPADQQKEVIEAGEAVIGTFEITGKPITLKLFVDDASNTDISISTNGEVDTSSFVLKAYDAAGEDLELDFASYNIVSSNGEVYPQGTKLSFPDKEGDYTFCVSADGVKRGEVELDGTESLSTNYTVANNSNNITVHVYKISARDRLSLVSKGKPFYYFNNNDVEKLDLSDYFTVERVTGDTGGTVIKDTQNLTWAIVSSNGSNDSLIKNQFKDALEKFKSEGDQLIALKGADASSVSAGQLLYVAVSSNTLGISSVEDTSESITIERQPIVIVAAEQIKGLQGAGLSSEYKDGKYSGQIKVYLVDENGKVVSENYAGAYTKQISDDGKLKTWTTSENAAIVIGSEIDGTVYGNQKVALDTTLNTEIAKNFVLYDDQKYTEYYITPSLLVSFTDLDGTSISDNAIYWDPSKPLEIVSFNSVDGSADRNTKDAKWYVKRTASNNGEYYQYLEDLTVTPINNKGEAAAPYTGARFDLSGYSSPVEIFVKFKDETGKIVATDKKNSNFGIEYIKPVFYTGEKLVANNDTKLKYKKGNNGVLDVVVVYNGKSLEYGDDYTLSYKNNVNAAESSAKKAPTVQVTGKGDYKGMKASATFNILKADFSKIADITMKNTYVKYTGKDFSKAVKATAVFSSGSNKGKKLNSKAYTIKVYELKDGVRSVAGSYAKNDTNVRTFEVVAISTGKDGNYAAGSESEALTIYGIPSSAKKLSVKGVTRKVKYDSSGVNLASFVDVKTATAKVGKKTYALSENKVLDVTLTDADGKDKTTTKSTDTGKYVVSVGPIFTNDNPCGTLSGDQVYEPTTIQVTHQGKKFSKSNVKLETSSFDYSTAGPTLNFVTGEGIDASKVKLYVPANNATTGNNGYAVGSTSDVTWTQVTGTLANYSSGIKASKLSEESGNYENFSAPGAHRIWVESTGEYTGGFYLSYTIKPIKYSKKDENIVVKINDKTDIQTLKYNPAGHDEDMVDVYFSDGKTYLPAYSSGKKTYTLTWKDTKVGDEGGTLTVKGTGTIFTGSITVKYNVAKSDIKSALNYDEVKTHDSEHVYYKLASKLRGSSTIPTKLVQVATNYGKDYKAVETVYELKSKTDYVVTMDTEGATATKGSATFDASSAKGYENSIKLIYSLYPNEIKSVDITLSNNGKVSMNEVNVVETIDDVKYYGIDVTKVVITYKDSSVKSETITGSDIKNTFNIKYSDNNIATTKAKVTLSFKSSVGTKYPTGTSYYKYYTITEK